MAVTFPGGTLDPPLAAGGSVLEKKTVTVDVPRISPEGHLAFGGHIPPVMAAVDGFEYRIRNAAGMSNPFLLTFAQYPVVVAHGDNDTAGKAQAVPVPAKSPGGSRRRTAATGTPFRPRREIFGAWSYSETAWARRSICFCWCVARAARP